MPEAKVSVVRTVHISLHFDDYNAAAGFGCLVDWWINLNTQYKYDYPEDMREFLDAAAKAWRENK